MRNSATRARRTVLRRGILSTPQRRLGLLACLCLLILVLPAFARWLINQRSPPLNPDLDSAPEDSVVKHELHRPSAVRRRETKERSHAWVSELEGGSILKSAQEFDRAWQEQSEAKQPQEDIHDIRIPREEGTDDAYPFYSAPTSKLIEYLRGKRLLVLQIDNRMLNLGRDADSLRKANFSGSLFGPSLISVSRWAKQNNYAYLLYIPTRQAWDALHQTELCLYWFKPPAVIMVHRLAKMAGLSGVLYIDSDVSPSYLTTFQVNREGAKCEHQTFSFDSTDPRTIEEFLDECGQQEEFESLEKSPLHFINPPGHKSAQGWVHQKLRFPPSMPVVNAGVLFFRTTAVAGEVMRYWYFNMTANYSRMEVSKARGEFFVDLRNASHRDAPRHVAHMMTLYTKSFPFRQDFKDDSICTPLLNFKYLENGRLIVGKFSCRGSNMTMLHEVWNYICSNSPAARKMFGVKMYNARVDCYLHPEVKPHTAQCWPGDQSRLQDLVMRDYVTAQHRTPNNFRLDNRDTVFAIFRDPILSGEHLYRNFSDAETKARRLLFHWGEPHEKIESSVLVSRILKQQTHPTVCEEDINEEDWNVEAWREVQRLPMFRFPLWTEDLNFHERESYIFGANGQIDYLNM